MSQLIKAWFTHIADEEITTEGTSNQDSLKSETLPVPLAGIPNSGLTQNMDRVTKTLPRNGADGNKPISVVPGCCPKPKEAKREVKHITPQLQVPTQQLRVEMRSNSLYYAQVVAIQNGSLLMSAFISDIPHHIEALEKHGETKPEQCKQTVQASHTLPLKEISNRSVMLDGRGIMACWKYISVFSYLHYTQA